jgi:hypothetical protein
LERLLRERRDLNKGGLAAYCQPKKIGKPFRAGTISAVVNSNKMPDIDTLQRIADGFTAYDRRPKGGNPSAPEIPLWEFFVDDEQARLLRTAQAAKQAIVPQEELIQRLTPAILAAVRAELSKTPDSASTTISQESLATGTKPAAREPFQAPTRKRHA